MARRYYSSTAARTTLASGVNDSTTTFTVAAVSGWPSSFPYTLIIDQDTINEEIVEVTARSGTTLTVTRGVDGTTGVAHDAGAAVNHGVSARDFDEPNAFINGTDFVSTDGGSTVEASGAAVTPLVLKGASGQTANLLTVEDSSGKDVASVSATGSLYAVNMPGRNLLYNGAMQVAQRGTSATGITSGGYFTADRWNFAPGSFGTWTQDIQNDAPAGSGFGKSFRLLCTTAASSPAAGSFLIFSQKLEGQDLQRVAKGTASAQQLTLSFWVKSNVTGTYICELNDADNSRRVSAAYTIDAGATWEKKTVTFPADTTGAFDNDNAVSLTVGWWLGAGSDFSGGSSLQTIWGTGTNTRATGQTNLAAATNNYWQVTGVQLEVGDTATPFEHLPYGVELARCQRYYKVLPASSNYPFTASCYQNGIVAWGCAFGDGIPFRANPSVSISAIKAKNTASSPFEADITSLSGINPNQNHVSGIGLLSGILFGQAFNIRVTMTGSAEL